MKQFPLMGSLGCAMFGLALLSHAAEVTPLQSQMSPDAFRAAGLDKLSDAELRELNAWLRMRLEGGTLEAEGAAPGQSPPPAVSSAAPTARVEAPPEGAPQVGENVDATTAQQSENVETATAEQSSAAETFGADELPGKKPEGPDSIRSHIVGSFTGWTGKTVFHLANGQVWQQRDSARYYRPMENPEVRIEKVFLGYRLVLTETGATVGVRRIK